MAVFAIADLHLSGTQEKSMDIFGKNWENHGEKIATHWNSIITKEDVVLIPGDISWAMKLEEAAQDFLYLGALPGTKVLLRGNHDYWWTSINKVRRALPPNTFALQNDAFILPDGTAICGTRGWVTPGSTAYGKDEEKIYNREIGRLRLSLEDAKRKGAPIRVVMMHYPPFSERQRVNGFTQLYREYGVKLVLYGHLHGIPKGGCFEGEQDGVLYRMVSSDYINFCPIKIQDI
ncbi:metallophosphoesterase [Eubacteriales bacterium OttesenSCG-928-M02]|nr:metallophosphoesterase [Eubacteriales bacterium OttesenSCG-928-M02]